MTSVQEVRRELAKFLAHTQTLDGLNESLSRSTWNIHREDASVRDLVGAIELRLAEFSDSQCDENELREHLTALLPNREVTISFDQALQPIQTATTSSSTSYRNVAVAL
jgi:hypothetical protein